MQQYAELNLITAVGWWPYEQSAETFKNIRGKKKQQNFKESAILKL